ncbi:hypothetical protein [Bifidobacterium sp. B4079]|uniref:hypothetical protein n=2 Tax=unclassified Bifidobacterium TaxID=2608897 RepID=UPI00226B4F0C|nr:hypothetical protein [Bifidobacterium sp. B4079]
MRRASKKHHHAHMPYIPDDVSQIPDNHSGYIPAPSDRRERLCVALHKRLEAVIDQESRPDLYDPDRKRLTSLDKQIREDLAAIRNGAKESRVRDLETKYSSTNLQTGTNRQ